MEIAIGNGYRYSYRKIGSASWFSLAFIRVIDEYFALSIQNKPTLWPTMKCRSQFMQIPGKIPIINCFIESVTVFTHPRQLLESRNTWGHIVIWWPADSMCCRRSKVEEKIGRYRVNGLWCRGRLRFRSMISRPFVGRWRTLELDGLLEPFLFCPSSLFSTLKSRSVPEAVRGLLLPWPFVSEGDVSRPLSSMSSFVSRSCWSCCGVYPFSM